MDIAQKDDIIVLAGKGHETYQEVCGVKHHMDEREIVADPSITRDYVVSSFPEAGEELMVGSTVYLKISGGPEIKTVTVPNLVGYYESTAINRIESANLAPKSKFVSAHSLGRVNSNGTNYRRHIAAGVTDTHLHMTEVWKGAFLWHHTGRLFMPLTSLPLEEAMVGRSRIFSLPH